MAAEISWLKYENRTFSVWAQWQQQLIPESKDIRDRPPRQIHTTKNLQGE